jgi:diamine N-acetyltransferase
MSESVKIRLRAPEPSDAQLLYDWENDLSLWNFSDNLSQLSMFQIEQFILNNQDIYSNRQIRFMIELVAGTTTETIGTADLYDYDPRHARAGVGILVAEAYRKRGYASKALDQLEYYAFEKLLMKQLYCYINADNISSIHIFQRRKYVQTGIRKSWIKTQDKWIDQFHFQLIKS